MAVIRASGARRSTAPTYDPYSPEKSEAINTIDPEQLRRQMFEYQAGAVLDDGNVGNNLSEAFGRGFSTMEGQGGSFSGGAPSAAGPGAANGVRGVGVGVSALGQLAKDPGLAQLGGMIGLGGALMGARSPAEAATTLAGPALGALGVPGPAIGLAKAAIDGDISLAVNSLIGALNPGLAAVNALGSLFGFGTVGSFAKSVADNARLGVNTGLGYSKASAINAAPDPLGALIGSMQDTWGVSVDPAYGDGSGGATSTTGRGYGISTNDSTVGGLGGRGGGRSGGGYGGGIGQSGGNAAGVGSAQA